MGTRASAHYLAGTTALTGPSRVSSHYLVGVVGVAARILTSAHYLGSALSVFEKVRISKHGLGGALSVAAPVRASAHYRVSVMSIHNAFFLTLLDSTSQIFPIPEWEVELVAGQIPEFNPYKPQVPESLIDIGGREFFDYIEENQKTLRLQHNITQAGDTTFPYQMIINSHDVKQFTLGAVGRFYHEDYGLVHARYVKYEKMDPALTPAAPVGLIKTTGNLDWVVTNRLEISDPHLIVGVQAAYVMPTDGQFGWVIVDGVNLQALLTEGSETAIGTPYVWSASGKVGPEGPGVVVCRRLMDGGDVALLRGAAYIRLEGASFGSIDVHFAQLLADVEQLKIDVQQINDVNNIAHTIATIQSSIKTLGNRINSEQNARQSADAAINARIDALNAVTAAQLNVALNALRNELNATIAGLENQLNTVRGIALDAWNKANQALAFNVGAIETQITDILAMIAAERVRAKGKFPVVDGSVPPNLVYLDDGSLVYEETF